MCGCNTDGTDGGSSTCADETGECTCDTSTHHAGTKCDMCSFGWLIQSDGSCRGNSKVKLPFLHLEKGSPF